MHKSVVLLSLLLLFTSCDYWNVKIDDVDDIGNIDDIYQEEQEKRSKLQIARESLADNELSLMQHQISQSLKTYESFNSLAQNLKNKVGADSAPFIELESSFMQEYGEDGKVIQAELDVLSNKFKKDKRSILKLKNKIQNTQKSFSLEKGLLVSCKQELTASKKKLDQKVKVATNSLKNSNKEIDGLLQKIKGKKEGVARNKKRKNNSNWPKDKKKYAKKAKKLAKQAKELANIATAKSNTAKSNKASFQKQINRHVKWTKDKAAECKKIVINAQKIQEQNKLDNSNFIELKTALIQTKNKITEVQEINKDFFVAYNKYQDDRNELTNGAQSRLDQLARRYEFEQERLILSYGSDYFDTFSKLKKWIELDQINGDDSLALINELKEIEPSASNIKSILSKMVVILKEASTQFAYSTKAVNYRNIASLLSDFTGIDINISDIGNIKVDLPRIDIDLTAINIDLPMLSLPKLNIEMPKLDVLDINISSSFQEISLIDITIPNINIMNLSVDLKGDVSRFTNSFKNIEIKVPAIEIAYIEVDLKKDLESPEIILKNSNREFTKAKADVDRTLTRAYHDLRREHEKAADDIKRKTGKGLGKVGKALEAAGQPENLARIAIVYAATVYAGPMGAALANSLLDKLEDPNMSDKELFNSFVIGAAAGYAAQGVTTIPIDSFQAMPTAASAITKNLTTDAGNILLNGKSYSAEDFLTSIASGAVNVNTGEDFANEILDSALNSAAQYSVKTLIKKEKFDLNAFEEQLYKGMADGLTRESIHALMDEYIVKHIPKDQDKKIFEAMKVTFSNLFLANANTVKEIQIEKFETLSLKDKKIIINELNQINDEFYEYLAETLDKDKSELNLMDLSSPRAEDLHNEFITNRIGTALEDRSSPIAKFNLTREEQSRLGRMPQSKLLITGLLVALSTYGTYETIEEGKRVNSTYEKYKKETRNSFGQFMLDHPAEFTSLSVDAALALLPQIKLLKLAPKLGVKVITSARKLGINSTKIYTKETIKYSKHALEQAADRGVPKSWIEKIIEKGQRYYDHKEKSVVSVLQDSLRSGQSLGVARDAQTGVIKTVMKMKKFNPNKTFLKGTDKLRYEQLP